MIFAQPIDFSRPRFEFAIPMANRSIFDEALSSFRARSLLPTTLTSAELAQLDQDIIDRAFFISQVANAELLQKVYDEIELVVKGEEDYATARLNIKNLMDEFSQPDELGSDSRINLMLNTSAATAFGYGQFMQSQRALDAAPAQELYRAFQRKVPRKWIERWKRVGGDIYDGKLIALVNDDIWNRLGNRSIFPDALGNPYPPFAFNSGMRVRSVDRRTATDLNLIDRDTQIEPRDLGFNDDLQVTPEIRDAALRKILEEEGHSFDGDVLTF